MWRIELNLKRSGWKPAKVGSKDAEFETFEQAASYACKIYFPIFGANELRIIPTHKEQKYGYQKPHIDPID